MSFLKKLRKPHLATFLASLILFVSCEKYEIIKQDSIITKYTAEEIFAGIFFLNNEFASEIEIISNSTLYEELNKYQNAREGIKDASDLIIKEIRDNDSSFFKNFETLIKSGNEYSIIQAIEIGTKKLIEATDLILEENGITKQELSTYIIDNNLNEFIDESGDINKKKLKEHLESLNNNEYKTQIQGKNLQGRCVAIGLIFFLGAFVLVAAVAGVVLAVNGGVVVNLAAAVFGWVEVAINRANAKDQTFEKKGNDLSFEMLVSQVVSISKN